MTIILYGTRDVMVESCEPLNYTGTKGVSLIKFHSKDSNAFSKSRSHKIPGILSLEHSPIYLSLTKPN